MSPAFLRLLLAFACACGFTTAAWAVKEPLPPRIEYVVKNWETDQALPHNSISGVVQRDDGFVWIATQGGLVRFDGVEFKTIRSPLIAGPRSSAVTAIIAENPDTLLINTIQSNLLRVKDGEVSPHPLSPQLNRGDNKIVSLFREADDVFWIVFRDRDVWRWDSGKVEKFPAPPPGSPRGRDPSFAKDKSGNVYLTRSPSSGVERYTGGELVSILRPGWPLLLAGSQSGAPWVAVEDRLFRIQDDRLEPVASSPVGEGEMPQAMLEDRSGALWLAATEQRLTRFKDGRKTQVEISRVKVNVIDEDAEGNIWVSSNGAGLSCVQPTRLHLIEGASNWTDTPTGSVTEDTEGNIWFANWKSVQKISNDHIEVLSQQPDWIGKAVPVCADPFGNIWMADGTQLFRTRVDATEPPVLVHTFPQGRIRVLFFTRDGTLWVGGGHAGLLRVKPDGSMRMFSKEEGFTSRNVRSIGEGLSGELWAGTQHGELFRFTNDRFEQVYSAEEMGRREIRALHSDTDGRLWISTAGEGLFIRQDGRLARIGLEQGLPDDVISNILEDDFGWLWFGSRRGIFKAAKKDLLALAFEGGPGVTPVLFGLADGLAGVSAVGSYQPTAWKTRTGKLWFVTRKGLVTTDPAMHERDHRPPKVYLEQVLLDGRVIDPSSEIINSSARRLEFRFTAPEFVAPERLRFRYKLQGFDSDWVESGGVRFAAYSRLSPGRYTFIVTAQQNGQPWLSAGPAISFEVRPMWWESFWVRLGGVALLSGVLILVVRYVSHRRLKARLARLEQERRVERERVRIARDLHDDLGSSLTYASMMAEELSDEWKTMSDPAARSAELASCVRTIVRDLDAVVWTVSPAHDNLQALSGYLRHFAHEYFKPTAVECRVHLGAGIPALPLSPEVRHHLFLIAKELFNNVLKHAEARRVDVTIRTDAGAFEITVSDDGRGFSLPAAAASGRSGIKNLHARAHELGATLEFSSPPKGTTVTLRLSLPLSGATPAKIVSPEKTESP
jgi:signal transduction histidine kinase/ligand-binding sensor domain-containing protein